MQKLITSFLLVSTLFLSSQTVLEGPFIKLKSGTILYGEKVNYEYEMFNRSKIKLDGSPYPANDVTYYRDENGNVFGNINGFTSSIGNGKGVYFFKTSANVSTTQNYSGSSYAKRTNEKVVKYFFSENFNEMKRVKLANFLGKMKDDPEANLLLKQAEKARTISVVSYVAAASTAIVGSAFLTMSSNDVLVYTIAGVALGGVITGIVYNRIKWKKTQKAIKQYYGVYLPIGE